jgi:plasmid stabilization system protein ParE
VYRVVFAQAALDAIDAQLAYFRSQQVSDAVMAEWLGLLLERVESLSHMPRRFPQAELVSQVANQEIRRLNHGEYALFYRVQDSPPVVEIMAFRHARRDEWRGPLPRPSTPPTPQ